MGREKSTEGEWGEEKGSGGEGKGKGRWEMGREHGKGEGRVEDNEREEGRERRGL